MRRLRDSRFTFTSGSASETRRIAEAIGRRIDRGVCISMTGALGAGKTVFVDGLCRGLDIGEDVISPTFVLYEEFEGRLRVCHVDLYRLEHEREIEELGLFDLIGTGRVIVVEWGDRSGTILDESDVVIRLHTTGPYSRTIDISCRPEFERWFERMEHME